MPLNLALISAQATGVVSPQSSAYEESVFTSRYMLFFHANKALLAPEMTYESR